MVLYARFAQWIAVSVRRRHELDALFGDCVRRIIEIARANGNGLDAFVLKFAQIGDDIVLFMSSSLIGMRMRRQGEVSARLVSPVSSPEKSKSRISRKLNKSP